MRSSKLNRILILLICLGLVPAFASAEGLSLSPHRAQFSAPSFDQASADETTTSPQLTGKKNIGRAAMFSLVIPGTGQLYTGSWLRAIPWFAVEVAGWALFSQYNSQGNDKTTEFEHYAGPWQNNDPNAGNFNMDAYLMREYQVAVNDAWSPDPYTGEYGDWRDLKWTDRNPHLPAPYTHDILTGDRQQYYEMIGKYYDQFGYGWNDTYEAGAVVPGGGEFIWGPSGDEIATWFFDGSSSMFFTYRDMRGDANKLLEKGNTMMELVLVNHVLSALDAAFAARRVNRKAESAALGSMDLRYDIRHTIEGDDVRSLTLSVPLPGLK